MLRSSTVASIPSGAYKRSRQVGVTHEKMEEEGEKCLDVIYCITVQMVDCYCVCLVHSRCCNGISEDIVPSQHAPLFCENARMCFALIGQFYTCQGRHCDKGFCSLASKARSHCQTSAVHNFIWCSRKQNGH